MQNLLSKQNLGISCLLMFSAACSPEKEQTRPNIVILYADDMGYGDLNIQNPDSKIPTPYLDQLARDGMRFTDAHSSSGVCFPAVMPCLQALTIGAGSIVSLALSVGRFSMIPISHCHRS